MTTTLAAGKSTHDTLRAGEILSATGTGTVVLTFDGNTKSTRITTSQVFGPYLYDAGVQVTGVGSSIAYSIVASIQPPSLALSLNPTTRKVMVGNDLLPAEAFTMSTVQQKARRLIDGYDSARPNALLGGAAYSVTTALSAAAAATTISSAAAVAINSFTGGFRTTYDRNGGFMRSPSNGSFFLGRRICASTIYPSAHGMGIGIRTMAPQVELALLDSNNGALPTSVIARVNGEWVTAVPQALPGTNTTNVHRYLLSFLDIFGGAHVAERFIEFFLPTQGFITGINVSQNHVAIVSGEPAASRIGVIGNSYAFGQGPTNPRKSPAHQIGERFGWRCDTIVSAVGGIGYVTSQNVGPSGVAVKFIDNIPGLAEFGRDYFDAIVVLGALTNDGAQPLATITAPAAAFWAEVVAAFPGTPMFCTGPFQWPGNLVSSDRIEAEKAAFFAATSGRIGSFYLDSTGYQDPTVTANYAADVTHPSDVGGVDLGINKIAPAIYSALKTL